MDPKRLTPVALLIAFAWAGMQSNDRIEAVPRSASELAQAVPLSVSELEGAARGAGLDVDRVEIVTPLARHPGVPFATRSWNDASLVALRERYGLETVVEGAADEWQAQLRLNHWLHQRIPNGVPEVEANDAMAILDAAAEGSGFWCSHFAVAYAQTALALGWQARELSLDHLHEPGGVGSRHHGAVEVWSNQWRKWIYLDPQSDLHFTKKGVPLSAREIRAEWLANGGADVAHVVGVPPNAIEMDPAIIWWDLPDEDETALFFWLIWHDSDSTWSASSPSPFYTPGDSAVEGRTWYQGEGESLRRHVGYDFDLFEPVADLSDLYWTVGVVETRIEAVEPGRITFALETYLPDFDRFEFSEDGDAWREVADPDTFVWAPSPADGDDSLSLRAVNEAGVRGPETSLVIHEREPAVIALEEAG